MHNEKYYLTLSMHHSVPQGRSAPQRRRVLNAERASRPLQQAGGRGGSDCAQRERQFRLQPGAQAARGGLAMHCRTIPQPHGQPRPVDHRLDVEQANTLQRANRDTGKAIGDGKTIAELFLDTSKIIDADIRAPGERQVGDKLRGRESTQYAVTLAPCGSLADLALDLADVPEDIRHWSIH